MAIAKPTKQMERTLKVANTSNVKEMKNGRPVSVKFSAEQAVDLPNCTIVTLKQVGADELDHVYEVQVLKASEVNAAVAAGTAYVVVAPEIMVEEARKTDGHIGLFRLQAEETYTAYQLSLHDRLEVSEDHDLYAATGVKVISNRTMAHPVMMAPVKDQLYTAEVKMRKIEFVKAQA